MREVKLHKPYKAIEGFKLFPQYIIPLKKVSNTQEIRYEFFDIEQGDNRFYLTQRDLDMAYEEIGDQYF